MCGQRKNKICEKELEKGNIFVITQRIVNRRCCPLSLHAFPLCLGSSASHGAGVWTLLFPVPATRGMHMGSGSR